MNAQPIRPRSISNPNDHGLMAVLGIFGGLAVVWGLSAAAGLGLSAWCGPAPERDEQERLAHLTPDEVRELDFVAHGKAMFMATCSACHGSDARGLPGKGKNLVYGDFPRRTGDAELAAFIKKGRPATDLWNTTKVDMPPKGGNSDMTDVQIEQVVSYLRALQNPHRISEAGLAAAELRLKEATERAEAEQAAARAVKLAERAAAKQAQQAAAPAPASGAAESAEEEEFDAETIALGGQLFASTCSTCHGKDAKGLPKNGKDLVHSAFCKATKNEDLIAFVKHGRGPGEPGNTTGIAMPPKGGNPALNDDKIEAIVAYIRSLQKAEMVGR
ncbi:MAG TPA: c-type cytochrome [Phycisphaerales bacterium]|nr:c-type cytochrome [Phycisphaerales bacterium]